MVPAEGRHRAGEDHVHPCARLPDVEEVLAVPEGPSLAEACEAADVPVAEWGVDQLTFRLELRVGEVRHFSEKVRVGARHGRSSLQDTRVGLASLLRLEPGSARRDAL